MNTESLLASPMERHTFEPSVADVHIEVATSASGKAIIVGEHAVVYGARAVAMPVVSMRMGVHLTRLPDVTGEKPSYRVRLGGISVSDHVNAVITDAFEALEVRPFSLMIEGLSSVLVGAGLGSSASLCIVLLRALAMASGKTLSPDRLSRLGNQLERRFHGNPSGLDTAVVALEKVVSFVKGASPTEVRVEPVASAEGPKSWRFALLDSGARSSTLAMIQKAAPYFLAPQGQSRVAQFDRLAATAIEGLGVGDLRAVAHAMTETSILLNDAGVVGESLTCLIELAQRAGVLAAKSTGAGGGGCVLVLLDPLQADSQVAALKQIVGATRLYEVTLP